MVEFGERKVAYHHSPTLHRNLLPDQLYQVTAESSTVFVLHKHYSSRFPFAGIVTKIKAIDELEGKIPTTLIQSFSCQFLSNDLGSDENDVRGIEAVSVVDNGSGVGGKTIPRLGLTFDTFDTGLAE